jgi:hypothetical protein
MLLLNMRPIMAWRSRAARGDWLEFFAGDIPLRFRPAGTLVCSRCGCEDTPVHGPGKGPHTASAVCRHCGEFIRWMTTKTPAELAERHAQRLQFVPPSARQLRYLLILGYEGPQPVSMAEASRMIEEAKARQTAR